MDTDNCRLLRARRGHYVPFFFLSAALTALGIFMIAEERPAGLLVAVGFGMATMAFAALLFNRSGYLLLTPRRLTVRSLNEEHSYRWSDIVSFHVGTVGLQKLVTFRRRDSSASPQDRDPETYLPGAYGMPPEKLAALLNEWRSRYAPESMKSAP